jgi:hypothetical protein
LIGSNCQGVFTLVAATQRGYPGQGAAKLDGSMSVQYCLIAELSPIRPLPGARSTDGQIEKVKHRWI